MTTKGFRFVEDPHGYFFDDVPVPSPSTVFADLGLIDPRFYNESARSRGKAVHAALHYAIKGTLDWDTLHQDLHGFVMSGVKLIERLKPKIVRYEQPMYHPLLGFAGMSDIEWDLDNWAWIVDWKTGKAPKVARYQTAAYESLARYQRPLFYKWKRACAELQEDGSTANLIRYEDHTDGAGWLNLLGSYRIRQQLRLPPAPFVDPIIFASMSQGD